MTVTTFSRLEILWKSCIGDYVNEDGLISPRGDGLVWMILKKCGVMEPDNGEEYDHYDYFLAWRGEVDENGRKSHVLSYSLLPFVPHVSMDFGEDSGYNSEDD
jgi:hypothetical protein